LRLVQTRNDRDLIFQPIHNASLINAQGKPKRNARLCPDWGAHAPSRAGFSALAEPTHDVSDEDVADCARGRVRSQRTFTSRRFFSN